MTAPRPAPLSEPTNVRLYQDDLEWVDALAAQGERSRSYIIRSLVRQAREATQPEQ